MMSCLMRAETVSSSVCKKVRSSLLSCAVACHLYATKAAPIGNRWWRVAIVMQMSLQYALHLVTVQIQHTMLTQAVEGCLRSFVEADLSALDPDMSKTCHLG